MNEIWHYVIVFAIRIALAFIPATIAKHKERSFVGFWFFGFFAFIPALIVSLIVRDLSEVHIEEGNELMNSPLMVSPQEKYAKKMEEDANIIKNGGWRCSRCSKLNVSSMGFCACGLSRGESVKMAESLKMADNV